MIIVEPTKNFTGIIIQGDYYDFSQLAESLYRMTLIKENLEDRHYGVKNRIQPRYFDIRLTDLEEGKTILKESTPYGVGKTHRNVYYSVNILFPEAVFMATAIPKLYLDGSLRYGLSSKRNIEYDFSATYKYADYLKDKANLDLLCAGIWQALGKVIGDEELEELIRLKTRTSENYYDYVTAYIDNLNLELINTEVEKRNEKLKSIAERIIEKSKDYLKVEENFKNWAQKHNKTIYELYDPDFIFPEDFEW